jgi:CRP-like cAMP-binding protein
MSDHPLWKNLFHGDSDWIRNGTDLCNGNPLFADMPAKAIRWLVSRMHPRSYEKGERIFEMGNPGAGAVLLLTGEISIMADQVELAHLKRGDLFGEVALVTGQPRTAEAVALTDCEVLFFLRENLKEWMESRPKQASRLLINLSEMLAQRLLEANRQLAARDTT